MTPRMKRIRRITEAREENVISGVKAQLFGLLSDRHKLRRMYVWHRIRGTLATGRKSDPEVRGAMAVGS
jgi:hypothetical protein